MLAILLIRKHYNERKESKIPFSPGGTNAETSQKNQLRPLTTYADDRLPTQSCSHFQEQHMLQ